MFQSIIWLNFDVRAGAGTFQIQINDNSGDLIGWALYKAGSPTEGITLNPNTGEYLSGDCADLTLISCGVESSNSWNTIPAPDFPIVSNLYMAVWDQNADGSLSLNNFKARYGCGDSDVCLIDTSSLTTQCLNDSYKVTIDVVGVNGTFVLTDSTGQGFNITPNEIVLTNSQDPNPVTSGTFCIEYPLGVDYHFGINETSGSSQDPNVPCSLNISGTAPVCPCGTCTITGPDGPVCLGTIQVFTSQLQEHAQIRSIVGQFRQWFN